jgi:hypothetical protein
VDAWVRKMKLAVDVLLGEADEISDGLETELYALRDKLDVMALEQARNPASGRTAFAGPVELAGRSAT